MSLVRNLDILFASAVLAGAASAQPAPSAAPAATGDSSVPKHGCPKAGAFPGNLASESQKRVWQKDSVGYTECLKKFIADQRTLAEPHVKASNAAIDEYNDAVKSYNEQIEKLRANY